MDRGAAICEGSTFFCVDCVSAVSEAFFHDSIAEETETHAGALSAQGVSKEENRLLCKKCGVLLTQEDIDRGMAVCEGGPYFCFKCITAVISVFSDTADTEELLAVTDDGLGGSSDLRVSPKYCLGCSYKIDPVDIQEKRAIFDGTNYFCPKCADSFRSLLRAVQEREGFVGEEVVVAAIAPRSKLWWIIPLIAFGLAATIASYLYITAEPKEEILTDPVQIEARRLARQSSVEAQKLAGEDDFAGAFARLREYPAKYHRMKWKTSIIEKTHGDIIQMLVKRYESILDEAGKLKNFPDPAAPLEKIAFLRRSIAELNPKDKKDEFDRYLAEADKLETEVNARVERQIAEYKKQVANRRQRSTSLEERIDFYLRMKSSDIEQIRTDAASRAGTLQAELGSLKAQFNEAKDACESLVTAGRLYEAKQAYSRYTDSGAQQVAAEAKRSCNEIDALIQKRIREYGDRASEAWAALSGLAIEKAEQIYSRYLNDPLPEIKEAAGKGIAAVKVHSEFRTALALAAGFEREGKIIAARDLFTRFTATHIPGKLRELASSRIKDLQSKIDSLTAGMVKIPAGTYSLGSESKQDDNPIHEFTTAEFYLDKYEVTNEKYHAFILATGHEPPRGWSRGAPPKGMVKMPVVGISAEDAAKYAAWKGKRLPTENEWEAAARGPKSAVYPWGDDWGAGCANIAGKQVAPVGHYSKDVSPFGVCDLAGNISEWTATRKLENSTEHAVRGGSFKDISPATARTTFRDFREAGNKNVNIGFRCAMDALK